jgi:glycosylphosphatidylinositol transamidase (GPIT) subunit GPI8
MRCDMSVSLHELWTEAVSTEQMKLSFMWSSEAGYMNYKMFVRGVQVYTTGRMMGMNDVDIIMLCQAQASVKSTTSRC